MKFYRFVSSFLSLSLSFFQADIALTIEAASARGGKNMTMTEIRIVLMRAKNICTLSKATVNELQENIWLSDWRGRYIMDDDDAGDDDEPK